MKEKQRWPKWAKIVLLILLILVIIIIAVAIGTSGNNENKESVNIIRNAVENYEPGSNQAVAALREAAESDSPDDERLEEAYSYIVKNYESLQDSVDQEHMIYYGALVYNQYINTNEAKSRAGYLAYTMYVDIYAMGVKEDSDTIAGLKDEIKKAIEEAE